MIRFGLCCQFIKAPIKFRSTTAAALLRKSRDAALAHVGEIVRHNVAALIDSVTYCADHGIGCFRVNSQFLPVKTHPQAGYTFEELPDALGLREALLDAGRLAAERDVRLVFHPDQFVVLNSPRPDVAASSIRELAWHAEIAELIGADVINIHGGGAYGDKPSSLARLRKVVETLPEPILRRLTFENDDRVYTPQDLLPVCEALRVPFVYDVHHHRVLKDGLSEKEATRRAIATWNREPLFHLSSPKGGWQAPRPEFHADVIDPADFPTCWKRLPVDLTVEIEAKQKEVAIAKLRAALPRTVRIRTCMESAGSPRCQS